METTKNKVIKSCLVFKMQVSGGKNRSNFDYQNSGNKSKMLIIQEVNRKSGCIIKVHCRSKKKRRDKMKRWNPQNFADISDISLHMEKPVSVCSYSFSWQQAVYY